jgi:hypothetical protein
MEDEVWRRILDCSSRRILDDLLAADLWGARRSGGFEEKGRGGGLDAVDQKGGEARKVRRRRGKRGEAAAASGTSCLANL